MRIERGGKKGRREEGGDHRERRGAGGWAGNHVALSEDPNVGLNVGVGRYWFL